MASPSLPRATEIAHEMVAARLYPGARAIDATAGNGHDTLFLAECVGSGGIVDAFDIQEEAIEQTRIRTRNHPQVTLHQLGHEKMNTIVSGTVDAVMFNLGYLPSGEKSIITRPETTLVALETSVNVLSPNGIVSVVVYTGHEGGEKEGDAVLDWAAELDPTGFSVAHYRFLNRRTVPPSLLLIERTGTAGAKP